MRAKAVPISSGVDRLLVVSDIHAFVRPLAAFDDYRAHLEGVSQVIFNGDAFIGGPEPGRALAWIHEHAGPYAVLGNHDEGHLNGTESERFIADTELTRRTVTAGLVAYMRAWPEQLDVEWRGHAIRLYHGHLTPHGTHGNWLASPDAVTRHFADQAVDLCITSHTHYAFVRRVGATVVANTGAMSYPIHGHVAEEGACPDLPGRTSANDPAVDIRSSFLSITDAEGSLNVEIVRFDWDRDAAMREIQALGLDDHPMRARLCATGIADQTTLRGRGSRR